MIKKTITVFCVMISFFGCGEFLRYVLVDDSRSYTRVMLHEMYTADKNIDIAFVGSSHAYRSFIPSIMDVGFKAYTFNAGSSGQLLDGSFAIIQEICTYHRPKRIFLELYHEIYKDMNFKKRKQMTETYILSDYMKMSWRKIHYLLGASDKQHYVNSLIIARRNWRKIFDYCYMVRVVHNKQSDAYKQYRLLHNENDLEYYVERGFVASGKVMERGDYWNGFANSKISLVPLEKNDWQKMLLKIIQYCKKKGVELTFVIAPLPEWSVVGMDNYQVYSDYVKNIADTYGVEFCDFNLCNSQYFDATDRRLFKDLDHLNTAGAEKFSQVFVDYFTGKIPKGMMFYQSLKDKLSAEQPAVFGFTGLTKEGKGCIISNREHGMEYQLEAISKEGAQKVIQEYSEEKIFTIPSGEHGKLILSWRMKGENVENKLEAEY